MQPNIPMKFAGYMARILLCKLCKFGEKICYNSGDIEFFIGDYFFLARPVYRSTPDDKRSIEFLVRFFPRKRRFEGRKVR